MGSRAFIRPAVPEDLIVVETPDRVEVSVAARSLAWVLGTRFVLFPLLVLPLTIYIYNISQLAGHLPPFDYMRLLHEPASYAAILPVDNVFRFFAALPWILAALFFSEQLFSVLRRARMVVTADGVTISSRFPTSYSDSVDLSTVTDIHIRDYTWTQGYKPHGSHFLALPAGEGIFDFLIGIEQSSDEGLRKLYTIADAIARLHQKTVKRFDVAGNEISRETKP